MNTMGKITKKMTLGDIVSRFPQTAEVMARYGLHCIGCHVAAWESLEDGAKAHGLSDKDIEKMLKEMNELASSSEETKISGGKNEKKNSGD